MLNPPPLNVQLYCAIRNKGYTTTDQTYEVVEAVLGVLSQQTPAPAPAVLSVASNVLEMLDGVFADTATGQKYLSEARALLQSAEVRHENNV